MAGLTEYEGAYGACYISAATETALATVNVALPVTSTTTVTGPLKGFSHTSPTGKLTYLAPQTGFFSVNISAVVDTAADTTSYSVGAGVNGAIVAASETLKVVPAHAVPEHFSSSCIVELDQGDYVEIMVENQTDHEDIEVLFAELVVVRL